MWTWILQKWMKKWMHANLHSLTAHIHIHIHRCTVSSIHSITDAQLNRCTVSATFNHLIDRIFSLFSLSIVYYYSLILIIFFIYQTWNIKLIQWVKKEKNLRQKCKRKNDLSLKKKKFTNFCIAKLNVIIKY